MHWHTIEQLAQACQYLYTPLCSQERHTHLRASKPMSAHHCNQSPGIAELVLSSDSSTLPAPWLPFTASCSRGLDVQQKRHSVRDLVQMYCCNAYHNLRNIATQRCATRKPYKTHLALHLLAQLLGVRALPLGQPALRIRLGPWVGRVKPANDISIREKYIVLRCMPFGTLAAYTHMSMATWHSACTVQLQQTSMRL